jgi:hypothetical protein
MSMKAEQIVENSLEGLSETLVSDDGTVGSEMGTTNATAFGLHGYEITKAQFSNAGTRIEFNVEMNLAGEQDAERSFSGSKLAVVVSGELELKGEDWEIEEYRVDSCKVSDF